MFRAILYTQWKWSRVAVLLTTVVAFTIPVLSVQAAGIADPTPWNAVDVLGTVQGWSAWYPFLALAIGLLGATTAWNQDHRGKHVHALTLPIPRWHYVLLRYGAGAVLLGASVFALWIGALVATSTATIPPGLESYPTALAFRFGLAVLVAFSLFFAISAGSTRTAAYVLFAIGGLLLIQLLLALANVDVNVVSPIFDRLITWPGPFEIFTGRWMLIDV